VTISAQQKSFLSEILEDRPIPESTLMYFRERFRDKLHSAILEAFLIRAQEKNLKQQDLAARIHRTKAQISRWFNAPSNITLDSISDLMVGLGMDFDAFPFTPIEKTVAAEEENLEDIAISLDELTELNKTLKSWMEEIPSGAESSASAQSAPNSGAMSDAIKTLQKQANSQNVSDIEQWRKKLRPKSVGEDDNTLLRRMGAR
jgi:transcriptional regulator with XRE-family HTH domain